MTQNITPPARKLRVLIADDVQETRRSTRLMLSTIPYVEVVAIASNGVQAVDMAQEHRPDIVISDINMPEMNGLAASKAIIEKMPGTACIIMSSEHDPVTLHAVRLVGVQEFLTKPFTLEELEQALARTIARLKEERQRLAQQARARQQQTASLLLARAEEYARIRRTDDEAVKVFEALAANPNCELRWLRTLAMVYVIRQEWGKLKVLAERLEKTK